MSEDKELERIMEKKRKRLLNRLAKTSEADNNHQKSVDDVDRVVLSLLDEKGREILSMAEQDFPVETRRAKLVLYTLVKKGFASGPVDAGDLYRFLRYLGIPVRYEARIVVADGKDRKPLSEILSERMAELEE